MQFWDELKERKLVQWALGYVAFGIAVLEVLNAVETPFGLSAALVRVIMTLVGVGLGVVLVLAWFHGERGHQRVTPAELLLLLLLAGAGTVAATVAGRSAPEPARPAAGDGAPSPGYPAGSAARPANSIAVLPLVNLTGNPQDDYLSDGITDELTDAIGRLPGLQVASRTSAFQFKGKRTDVREVGTRLGVAAVLEGTVQRSGSRVRILVHLVDARTGYQLWQDRIETDAADIFAAEDRISRSVAGALQVKLALAREPTESSRAPDTAAHQAYLKARYYAAQSQPDAPARAERQFRVAVQHDSTYAPAYAGLAGSFLDQARWGLLPRQVARDSARSAARRAVELDSTLPDPYLVLARTTDDPAARAKELRKAVALNPNLAEAQVELAKALAELGQKDEAMRRARDARRLDPLGNHSLGGLGEVLALVGHPEQVVRELRAIPGAPAIPDPNALTARIGANLTGSPYTRDAGLQMLRDARRAVPENPEVLRWVALGEARAGLADQARATLAEYERHSPDAAGGARVAAAVFGALGLTDSAFHRLDGAVRAHPEVLGGILGDSLLAPLRRDPRWAVLQRGNRSE